MEKFIRDHNAAMAGLRASPARVMDRRVHAYLRRHLHEPESLNALAAALFVILQATSTHPAPSARRYLRVLARRALMQVVSDPALDAAHVRHDPYRHFAAALAGLPPVHAAVVLGRKHGLDDVAIASATRLPGHLVPAYYSQAYAMIRCTPWNS